MIEFVAFLFAVALGAGGMYLLLVDFKGYRLPPAQPEQDTTTSDGC